MNHPTYARYRDLWSEPGRVVPVHVRDGLTVGCGMSVELCAGANRVDTTRLVGEKPRRVKPDG